MSTIQLYKDSDFRGRAEQTSNAISNLKNYGFNDQASSCRIEGGPWLLYSNADFGGQSAYLDPGSYAHSGNMHLPNDSLSSLRPLPPPTRATVCLFEDTNYRGRMVVLHGPETTLSGLGFNDEVSSIIVLSGTWRFYQDRSFRGQQWILGPGKYPTAAAGGFDNDKITSARPE